MRIIVRIVLKNPSKLLWLITTKGFNQSQFAKHIGITQSTLSYVLHKKRTPSPTTARKIAKGVGETIPDIFLISLLTEKTKKMIK